MIKSILAAIKIFSRLNTQTDYRVLYLSAEFIVIEVENKISLVFFGSDSWSDWVDNFYYRKVSALGFPLGWEKEAIAAKIVIDSLGFSLDYAIGYSRGAAIALIYGYINYVETIAFSSPKVSKRLLYWTKTPIIIQSQNDIIPLVPLGFYYPGNYSYLSIPLGGHFWSKDKYVNEITIFLKEPLC